jgi:hypothetical protein
MNPVREGPATYLTDCNVSYKRPALTSISDVWAGEFHETSVNWTLQARGESLWLSPRIIVHGHRRLTLVEAIRDRYAFGRLFASTRVAATTPLGRAFYAGSSFLLPPLLLGRVAVNVLRKRRGGRELARAIPALLCITIVWACGEFVGYLTGRPGASLTPNGRQAAGRQTGGQEAPA